MWSLIHMLAAETISFCHSAKAFSLRLWFWTFVICLGPGLAFSADETSTDLPSASMVVAKIIQRAKETAKNTQSSKYTYRKRSRMEELNARGEPVESSEKIYDVVLIGGWPYSRLVAVEGKNLSPEEIRREDEKEQAFRKKLAGRDRRKDAENEEPWITEDLMNRFDWVVASNVVHEGRSTLVLSFTPRKGAPEREIQDRIINRFHGLLWVDVEDAEVARAHAGLTDELSLGWFGLVGSLKQCDLKFDRDRLPDGTWVDQKHTVAIIGRKLFSAMRFRGTDSFSDFRRTE
jgi:hypothetical protein